MLDPIILSTFWDVVWASFIVFFIVIPLIMLWVFALTDLFVRRDLAGWAKVVWLPVLIFLPLFGPLIYLLTRPDDVIEAEIEATAPKA